MDNSRRWDSAVMSVFSRFLKTDGWYLRVTRGPERVKVLEVTGGDFISAKAAIRAAYLADGRAGQIARHVWQRLTIQAEEGTRQRDALVFVMPSDNDHQIEGAILTPESAFRASNFKSERDLLEFLREEVMTYAGVALVEQNMILLAKLASAFSETFMVVDRSGTPLGSSDGGVQEVAGLLGARPGDDIDLKHRVRAEITRFEDGGAAEPSALPSEVNGPAPFRVIRLTDMEDYGLLGGPFYAIIEPKMHRFPDAEALQRHFGMTPSEANVVENLVEGLTVDEIAKTTKLSEATVRTYLKRCFAKAGVKGQPQLIVKLSHMSEMSLSDG